MTSMMKAGLFALCAAALTACSSDNEGAPELSRVFASALREGLQKPDLTASNQAVLAITKEQVDASTTALLRVHVIERDARATMVEINANGNARTFFTGDEASITLQNDILIKSGSFGGDLMGLALSAHTMRDALAAGQTTRSYRYLDGLNKEQRLDVTCTVSQSGSVMTLTLVGQRHRVVPIREACAGDGVSFVNQYWMESGSTKIWKSIQWIGPAVGQISIEMLKRDAG